ncbi:MAG TPA: retropepsin-like aspartic protease [Nitrospira sp.]|nr:retropepsin-like aspartic protease [Nitrospira sp.]
MTSRCNQAPLDVLPIPRMAPATVLTVLTLVLLVVPTTFANGTLFECVDAHGKTVFTDSPRQFLSCHAVNLLSPKASTGPMPPTGMPFPPNAPQHVGKTPSSPLLLDYSHATAVPVERSGSVLVVMATLNDSKQARLIVDTGASQTIISRRLATELGLASTAYATRVLLHTASGSVQVDAVILNAIRIGGAELRNSQVLIHDLPDLPFTVDGLLGLSFLGAYQITLDSSRGELHLKSLPEKTRELGDR